MRRTAVAVGVILSLLAVQAWGLHPGKDLLVPAASRGTGTGGSQWATALCIYNPSSATANVTVFWLVRGRANPSPLSVSLVIQPGETLVRDDAIQQVFGIASGNGAIRVVSDVPVLVNAQVLNRAGGVEFGQGSEGIPVQAAVASGKTTHAVGLKNNASFRTNIYLIDATGGESAATVALVGPNNNVIKSKEYALGAYQPVLESMTAFGAPNYDNATMVVTVTKGAVIAGASRVNNSSGDPITLSAWWPLPSCGSEACFAPTSAVGASGVIQVPVPGEGTMSYNFFFLTATTGKFIDGRTAVPFTYSSYLPSCNAATLKLAIPEWGLANINVTATWSEAKKGIFFGTAVGPDGEELVGGSFILD
jgi:hypothetical protein